MERDIKTEKNHIEKMLTENFVKLMPTFYEMQSAFLSGLYRRYGDLEEGNIVLFFARDLHLEILRKRENDFSGDFFTVLTKNLSCFMQMMILLKRLRLLIQVVGIQIVIQEMLGALWG